MAAYLRIDGLNPEDLNQEHHHLFGDLANNAFDHIREEHPDLYEDLEGVIPVRNPEHDPRLLETTAVYAHRDETVDDGVSDFVFCSFADVVDGFDAPGYADACERAEVQLREQFDGVGMWLDFAESLPSEQERDVSGEDPVRVGTLYLDGDRAIRVDFDHPDVVDGEDDE